MKAFAGWGRHFLLGVSAMALLAPATAAAQDGATANPLPASQGATSIIVTGSRVARSTFETASPVTLLGGDDLARRGITNVAEAITELPSFRDSTSPQTQGFGSFNVGARISNLRGLGVTRNLILVDGRRFAPTTREGSVDLNFIPSVLIARTEIVTGGASAAYGSDAITGVVNIILDNRFEGIRAEADFGISESEDGERYHAAAAFGTRLGDRGHLVLGGEWADQRGIGNCFTRDWCTAGAVVTNVGHAAGGGNGLPNFVRSNDNAGFRFNPSGVIIGGAANLFGTGGVTFDANGQPIPFRTGSPAFGLLQVGGDIIPTYRSSNITVPVERWSLNGHLSYELADDLDFFLTGTYGHVAGELLQTAFFSTTIPIFADNPFIPQALRNTFVPERQTQPTGPYQLARPTAGAFTMLRLFDDFARGFSTSEADTMRVATGLNGRIGNWDWDGYYQYSQTDRLQKVENNLIVGAAAFSVANPATIAQSNARFFFAADAVIDPNTGQPTCRALLSPDPALRAAAAGCRPLNLFGAGRYDPAARDYVYGTLVEEIDLSQHVVAGNLRGTLLRLPAGDLAVAVGAEYRVEEIDVLHDDLSNLFAYFQNFGADYNGRTEVVEGYLEAELPILSNRPMFEDLAVNAAIRQTHYDISGFGSYLRQQVNSGFDATAWKVSANWSLADWVRLRGSRSRDIRAPNFAELFLASASAFTVINNPFNPGQNFNPSLLSGGSPFLRPEKADTWGLGLIVTPGGVLEGFRFSVDWFDIRVRDFIGTPPGGAQNIVNECFTGRQAACALINNGTISPGQNITEIRNVSLNLEELRTRGLDFEADYRINLANGSQLLLRALATYVDELSTLAFGQRIDRAGQTGVAGSVSAAEWTANGFVTLIAPRFTVTAQGRYIGPGVYNAEYIGPGDPGYATTRINSINDNSVPSRFYVNLSGTVNLGPGWRDGEGLQLFWRIANLFDVDPPIAPETQFPTNPVYFDTIGRYYTLGARLRF